VPFWAADSGMVPGRRGEHPLRA